MAVPRLLPDTDPAVAALAHDLERARATSYPLTFAVARLAGEPAEPAAALDALAAELGYRGLGAAWIELPRRIAARLLVQLISSELAYPAEVVARAQAEALAQRFLALVPPGARFFTNGAVSGEVAVYDSQGEAVLGWRSISEAPLDNGLVALGGGRVAILWAEDAP